MSETQQSGPSKGKLAILLVAVAALAAGGGAIVANSLGGDSDSASGPAAGLGVVNINYDENDPLAPSARGYDEVHQGGSENRDNVLISTEALADIVGDDGAGLADENIVLIEVSENLAINADITQYTYEEAHIPGAHELNWYEDFFEANKRDFVHPEQLTELLQGLGVNDDSTIVLYGDHNNWFAAYAAWVLKLHGAEDVRLLDGGRWKWEQDELPLTDAVPTAEAGNWEAQGQNLDLRAFQPEVLEVVAEEKEASLIDIRSEAEFNGEIPADPNLFPGEGAAVWGHIPGAINVGWGAIVNEDGTFKSNDEIRQIYADAGVDLDGLIITYCRIGERASHTWYALSQLLDLDVKVYDGSWSEWGNTVGVPIANDGERRGVWSSAS